MTAGVSLPAIVSRSEECLRLVEAAVDEREVGEVRLTQGAHVRFGKVFAQVLEVLALGSFRKIRAPALDERRAEVSRHVGPKRGVVFRTFITEGRVDFGA